MNIIGKKPSLKCTVDEYGNKWYKADAVLKSDQEYYDKGIGYYHDYMLVFDPLLRIKLFSSLFEDEFYKPHLDKTLECVVPFDDNEKIKLVLMEKHIATPYMVDYIRKTIKDHLRSHKYVRR